MEALWRVPEDQRRGSLPLSRSGGSRSREREAEGGGERFFFLLLSSRFFPPVTIFRFFLFAAEHRFCRSSFSFPCKRWVAFLSCPLFLSLCFNCEHALLVRGTRLARNSRPEGGSKRVQRAVKRTSNFDAPSLCSLAPSFIAVLRCLVPSRR